MTSLVTRRDIWNWVITCAATLVLGLQEFKATTHCQTSVHPHIISQKFILKIAKVITSSKGSSLHRFVVVILHYIHDSKGIPRCHQWGSDRRSFIPQSALGISSRRERERKIIISDVKVSLGAGHGRGMCEIKQLYKFDVSVSSWIKEKDFWLSRKLSTSIS